MALTIVPCCSFDNCPDDKTVFSSRTEQSANHESGDDDGCGSCSPFFTCEGCICASFISEQITFTFDIIPPVEITYAGLITSFHSYELHSIWQPPQLV